MPFGQLVIGPPGSGKTTYAAGMAAHLRALGRTVALVNLDPANDVPPPHATPDVDVGELVDLAAAMEAHGLGPNGGLLFCMEYLAANLDWLAAELAPLVAAGAYFIFDCPGQVELFTGHHPGFQALVRALTRPLPPQQQQDSSSGGGGGGAGSSTRGQQQHGAAEAAGDDGSKQQQQQQQPPSCLGGFNLTAVHLVDAHLATDAPKYISALLLCLSTMLALELPQVNVLSKVDLVPAYGRLAFNLDYYTQVHDLSRLVAGMGGGPWGARYRKLTAGLADVVEGYGLVGFTPLAIQEPASLARLLGQVDRANGACYARLDGPPLPVPAELLAAAGHSAGEDELGDDLQERYLERGARGQQQQQDQLGASMAAVAAAAAAAAAHAGGVGGGSSSTAAAVGPVVER